MRFRATVELGGKTATGITVPDDVVTALGRSRRPAVRVTIAGYTYRSTIAAMGGRFIGMPGRNRQMTVRMLHVCEVRNGKISRENVWMDAGAAVAQLSRSE